MNKSIYKETREQLNSKNGATSDVILDICDALEDLSVFFREQSERVSEVEDVKGNILYFEGVRVNQEMGPMINFIQQKVDALYMYTMEKEEAECENET